MSSTRQLLIGRANSVFKNAIIYGGLDYDATSEQLIAANKKLSIATSHILKSNTMALRSMDGISISTKYDALEGSKREAEFISKHLRNNGFASVVYDKSRGTEESFKAMSGNGPSLLHIATHGFYWTEDEAELEKRKSDILRLLILNDNKLSIEDKAMTRSGLTMAGCNRAFDNNETMLENLDDGFLTAKEISLLDLRGLDLVVLSGCETAQGDISVNEGIFGLQRAFKKAGAQTIMMSLWDVNDTATEQMMKFFYTHLVAGESIHQSFIAAQQELRAIYPDPSHWAAFILLDALE